MAASSNLNTFKIKIVNIPPGICSETLREYFSRFGEIDVSFVTCSTNGYVTFATKEGFEEARHILEHELNGQVLNIIYRGPDDGQSDESFGADCVKVTDDEEGEEKEEKQEEIRTTTPDDFVHVPNMLHENKCNTSNIEKSVTESDESITSFKIVNPDSPILDN